jgi:hypothetical protein
MSRIPSSAMPHAKAPAEGEEKEGRGAALKKQAGKIAEKAKENPKTAIAAGVVAAAGVAAAAAIPLLRGGKGKSSGKKEGGGSGGSRKKKS